MHTHLINYSQYQQYHNYYYMLNKNCALNNYNRCAYYLEFTIIEYYYRSTCECITSNNFGVQTKYYLINDGHTITLQVLHFIINIIIHSCSISDSDNALQMPTPPIYCALQRKWQTLQDDKYKSFPLKLVHATFVNQMHSKLLTLLYAILINKKCN